MKNIFFYKGFRIERGVISGKYFNVYVDNKLIGNYVGSLKNVKKELDKIIAQRR